MESSFSSDAKNAWIRRSGPLLLGDQRKSCPFRASLQGDIRFIQGVVRREETHLDSTESYAALCFADATRAEPRERG